jgi:hypothetical protein
MTANIETSYLIIFRQVHTSWLSPQPYSGSSSAIAYLATTNLAIVLIFTISSLKA